MKWTPQNMGPLNIWSPAPEVKGQCVTQNENTPHRILDKSLFMSHYCVIAPPCVYFSLKLINTTEWSDSEQHWWVSSFNNLMYNASFFECVFRTHDGPVTIYSHHKSNLNRLTPNPTLTQWENVMNMKIVESSVLSCPPQNLSSTQCNLSRDRGVGHRVALKGVDTAWHDAGRQPLFIVRAAAIHNGENDEMLPL